MNDLNFAELRKRLEGSIVLVPARKCKEGRTRAKVLLVYRRRPRGGESRSGEIFAKVEEIGTKQIPIETLSRAKIVRYIPIAEVYTNED